ncbi:MAG: RES family NAD+ phosphorylase [Rhodospirillaceae bacterium]|nr:RES family NAD+ phosphorylase [Rhodospirillaceae bacterium]
MASATAGPQQAPGPPTDLDSRSLPFVTAPPTVFYRVHQTAYAPIYLESHPPRYRYDDPAGGYGTLYCAATLTAAFLETLVRNPNIQGVAASEIAIRSYSEIQSGRELHLVDFCGAGLSRVGTDAGVSTGPYSVSRAWSAALHQHPDKPDGIAYRSRFDPALYCYAMFDRTQTCWSVVGTFQLTHVIATPILTTYCKVLY